MEVPISAMIVLFVSILVASAIIVFSTDIITDAKQKINTPFDEEDQEEKILDVQQLTQQSMDVLIGQCYEMNKQEALERTLCFVVHGQNPFDLSLVPANVGSVQVSVLTPEPAKTIFMYYNPAGDLVEVTS